VPKLGIDNENGAVCSRNRTLATNSPKPGSSAESSFDTLQGRGEVSKSASDGGLWGARRGPAKPTTTGETSGLRGSRPRSRSSLRQRELAKPQLVAVLREHAFDLSHAGRFRLSWGLARHPASRVL